MISYVQQYQTLEEFDTMLILKLQILSNEYTINSTQIVTIFKLQFIKSYFQTKLRSTFVFVRFLAI